MKLLQLGSRVKAERKRQGLTLEVLSERIGISRNFLWEIEAGRKAPALATLYNLGISLNVSIDYLMGVTEEHKRITGDDTSSERDIQISNLLKQLHRYNDKELHLVSNILNEITEYINESQS